MALGDLEVAGLVEANQNGGKLEQRVSESSKLLQCIKATLLASLNGYSPALAVEFGRKVLFSTERPSFVELEQHLKQSKAH